jgi:hypothetical protein
VALEDPAATPFAEREAANAAPPPEAELPKGAEIYLEAFWQLTTDRPQSGLAVHPIPFAAIDAYARRYGIQGEAFDALVNAVRAADQVFMAVMAERLKAERDKAHGEE